MSKFNDINELLDIARNINEGNYDLVDINISPESELFHIAQYFSDALKRLQTISDAVEDTFEDLPGFENILKEVVKDAKEASENVLECIDKINFNTDDIKENLTLFRKYAENGDTAKLGGIIDRLRDKGISGQDISFDIIASLEFHDITKQKIDKLIKIVYDLQDRLTHLVILLGIKDNKIDAGMLDKIKNKDEILQDQDLVDELMKEFGL